MKTRHVEPVDPIPSLVDLHRLVMSGLSLDSALTHAVLVHPTRELTAVQALVAEGESIQSASRSVLTGLSEKKHPTTAERDVMLVLHVLSFADSIGGRVADHLDSLLDILKDRAHQRVERVTQAANATASMRLLTWLPLVCGAWILLDSPHVRSFLLTSSMGWMCLTIGVGLNVLGRLWLRREILAC